MQEKELEIAGGSLYYEERQDGIAVTRMHGMAGEVTVPAFIKGSPVVAVGRKAFLSKKNLRRVFLPETVKEIGDWAFAYCDSLKQVTLPCQRLFVGKAVFLECRQLDKIMFAGAGDQIPALLAAAVNALEAYYLLDPEEAGSGDWLEKWDARLFSLLHIPDVEGYAKQVLCGEEDYGSTDLEAFLRERRKSKVRLSFLRLLNPEGLSRERKEELETYLRSHTKGCDSEETWQVVLSEHGNDRAYYRLFADLGCITENNFQEIVGDIGEDKPEMKAYFMRWKEENMGYRDFFDGLEL